MNLKKLEEMENKKLHFHNHEINEIHQVLSIIENNIHACPLFTCSNQHHVPELCKKNQITYSISKQYICYYDQNEISTLSKTINDVVSDIKKDSLPLTFKSPIEYFVFFQSEHILAAANTLRSIDFCYHCGFISDAFVLLRKYRDDLLQYLFISNVLTEYNQSSNCSISKTNDKLKHSVEAWLFQLLDKNDIISNSKRNKYKESFQYSSYSEHLKSHILTKDIFEKYFPLWDNNNKILNDFVHVNSINYISSNIPEKPSYFKSEFLPLLHMITDVFLSCEILLEGYQIRSDDYTIYMNLGLTPPLNSQYWISDTIYQYIKKHFSTELIHFLEKNKWKMNLMDYSV